MHRVLAFLILFLCGTGAVHSGKRAIVYGTDGAPGNWSRAACGSTCRIVYSPGGSIDQFYEQLNIAQRDRIKIVLDGHCVSACTMFLDHMRPRVCITQNAALKFHNGTRYLRNTSGKFVEDSRLDVMPAYSADIRQWIEENGGLPGKDLSPREMAAFLTMPFDEARKFFKVC